MAEYEGVIEIDALGEIIDKLYSDKLLCGDLGIASFMDSNHSFVNGANVLEEMLLNQCIEEMKASVAANLDCHNGMETFISSFYYSYVNWAINNRAQDYFLSYYLRKLSKDDLDSCIANHFSKIIDEIRQVWIESDLQFDEPMYLILSLHHCKNMVLDYLRVYPKENVGSLIDLTYSKLWKGLSPYKLKQVITVYR